MHTGLFAGLSSGVARIAPKNNIVIKIFDYIANLYVTVIRGTPVVLQLLIMYFVVLQFMNNIWEGVLVAIITFGLNSARICPKYFGLA